MVFNYAFFSIGFRLAFVLALRTVKVIKVLKIQYFEIRNFVVIGVKLHWQYYHLKKKPLKHVTIKKTGTRTGIILDQNR